MPIQVAGVPVKAAVILLLGKSASVMSDVTPSNPAAIEQAAFSRSKTLAMIEERVAEIVWLCDFAKGSLSDTDRYFLGFAKRYALQAEESAQWALSARCTQPKSVDVATSDSHTAG
ncbi:hypothetical protein [Nevskia ramosa]|uniref:hypothetical protein n=1 Tax=Nevskia ramosa TaxID=64002 RepID=UPI002353E29B|nr:hypothetical protein [Nevskia ramosa]